MKFIKKPFFAFALPLVVAISGLFAGGARAEDTLDKAAVKTKQVIFSIVDKTSYTVSFKKGSSALDSSSRNSLKALIKNAAGDLSSGEIVVAGWSDHEFPMSDKVKMSQADAALAKSRIDAVSDYIKSLKGDVTIVGMNMAEQNTLLSRLFNSDEDHVKEAIQTGETDSRKVATIAKTLKDKGGPSSVVVLVRKPLEVPNS